MRRVSQLICLITLSVLLIFLLPIQAMAETTSDEVREYAETEGLETFLEIAPQLNLKEGIKTSDLVIGEAFQLFDVQSDYNGKTLGELLVPKTDWLVPICTPNGEGISFLKVHTANGFSCGGGGDSSYFIKSVNKMRELIRQFGDNKEPTVISYKGDYFLYYSFNDDERVIQISSFQFNTDYLDVSDYTQLPTGNEMIEAIQEDLEFWRNQDPSAVGGSTIELPVRIGERSLRHSKNSVFLYFGLLLASISVIIIRVIKKRKKREA